MSQQTITGDCRVVLKLIRDLQIDGIPGGWERLPETPGGWRKAPGVTDDEAKETEWMLGPRPNGGYIAVPFALIASCIFPQPGEPNLQDIIRELLVRELVQITPLTHFARPNFRSPLGFTVRCDARDGEGKYKGQLIWDIIADWDGAYEVTNMIYPLIPGDFDNNFLDFNSFTITKDGFAVLDGEAGGETHGTAGEDRPALSQRASAALDLLLSLPPHLALTAGTIVTKLNQLEEPVNMDESTFRKYIVPELKPYGLENAGHKKGYRINPGRRP